MNPNENLTLKELNALTFDYNKPVVAFIALFVMLGIVGNSLVLYVYMFRMKSSTLKVFIVYLGFVDMLGCCVGAPLEMIDLILPVMYPASIFCKSQHVTIYISCISSVLTLLVIAVERFNRVCRPMASQTSPLQAKKIMLGVTLISLLVNIPVFMVYRREEIQFENGIIGYVCWSEFPYYWQVYFLVLLTLFWIFLLIIFVLYFLIWKKAREHFRQVEARRHKPPADEADHLANSHHETKLISSQVNMTIFGITTLFVISFAPNFVLNLVQPQDTDKTYALVKILHRLWVLNCSLNPIVYGICNGEFRQEFKKLFNSQYLPTSSHNTKKSNDIEL